jgi:hypothetical protein
LLALHYLRQMAGGLEMKEHIEDSKSNIGHSDSGIDVAELRTKEDVRDFILSEREKGNLVVMNIEGLMSMPVDGFVKQPADGMLYDLNRLEEVSLTFIADQKWVNDFAVALTIRKLVQQRDELLSALRLVTDALNDPGVGDHEQWKRDCKAATHAARTAIAKVEG